MSALYFPSENGTQTKKTVKLIALWRTTNHFDICPFSTVYSEEIYKLYLYLKNYEHFLYFLYALEFLARLERNAQ